MSVDGGNLLRLPSSLPAVELVEPLAEGPGWHVERIVSTGQSTPAGTWLEQPWDEWVALLTGEATLRWEGGRERRLAAGDWLLIPAGERHRVQATSEDPPCVWIAVHVAPARHAP